MSDTPSYMTTSAQPPACEHDFMFIRPTYTPNDEFGKEGKWTDIFRCRRCLEKQTVPS